MSVGSTSELEITSMHCRKYARTPGLFNGPGFWVLHVSSFVTVTPELACVQPVPDVLDGLSIRWKKGDSTVSFVP